MRRRVLITGCSGGGKSTLLAALAARGFQTVAEPGLRIVRSSRPDDPRLPWNDAIAFGRAARDLAAADFAAAAPGVTLYDRGLLDAIVHLKRCGAATAADDALLTQCRYDHVFLAPPWRAYFAQTDDRRHTFEAAVAEYEAITSALTAMGARFDLLPRTGVEARAAFVVARL